MGGEESGPDDLSMKPAIPPDSQPMHVLHRDLSTQNQLAMLLSVSGTMMEFLTKEPKDADNIPGQRPLPGEARLAAEATLIKACARIDGILEDARRWGIDYQLSLEKLYTKHFEQARKLSEKQAQFIMEDSARARAQKEAAEEVKSPHFQYRPSLLGLEDGSWVAFLGDPNKEGESIIGVGASPATALKAFDLVFRGKLTPAQEKLAAERNKQTDKNETNTVDQSGTEPPQDPDRGGDADQRAG